VTGPVLLDNTVLSNLASVNRPDLATRLWGDDASTTAEALAEYAMGVIARSLPADAWAELPIASLAPEELTVSARLPRPLGPGERSCLAVAIHRRGSLATDDLDARRAAERHGVQVIGTVGILLLLTRRGDLAGDEANGLLAEMIAAGYRSPVPSLDPLLDE
jgi:predicted nucleic acid-binding protein